MIKNAQLIEIVGSNNVICDKVVLDSYSRDVSFVDPIMPACIVRPHSGGEVEKIVKLACETKTPLIPISSGAPHFKGDTVPSIDNAVIVDLSEMKKIIRVDRENRVAMVEPGVTFSELIPELKKEGLRLNMPLLPRSTKSVVGSLLEREPPIMPKYHWDNSDPLACLEIVFGTGDIFRTGGAAGPGTIEEQWKVGSVQKVAEGPSQASLHRIIQGAQGTMGIVTWASMRCELLPELEEPFFIGSVELNKIIELVHWLIRLRLVDECFILNDSNLAAILAKKWDDYEDIKKALPSWILFFNISGFGYFSEERLNYQIEDMKDVAQRVGLEPVKAIAGISALTFLDHINYPFVEPYWKFHDKRASYDIFFLTTQDKIQEFIQVIGKIAKDAGYMASEIGIYIQPVVQGTCYHLEFNLFFNLDDPNESTLIESLADKAVKRLINKGAFFSRPYGKHARLIVEKNPFFAKALKKVKAIFDPNNIMNPGKLCF